MDDMKRRTVLRLMGVPAFAAAMPDSRGGTTVVTVDGEATYRRQTAGHAENGKDSISDPAMGGVI